MAKKYLIGGNWKCVSSTLVFRCSSLFTRYFQQNGSLESNAALIKELNEGGDFPALAEVVIAPTALHIGAVKASIRPDINIAAQSIGLNKGSGAFTGDISADMVADFGLSWAIAGHSERRALNGESNEDVAIKTKVGIEAGLSIIVCIGEQLADRESGNTGTVIFAQLQAVADVLSAVDWGKVVVAYEPVWAIGTGVVATPDQAQETHEAIRGWLTEHVSADVAAATRIIYGGSVKGANVQGLVSCADIDGFLVGGASLKADFLNIIKAVPVETAF
jgi:triosephosphate isomerase